MENYNKQKLALEKELGSSGKCSIKDWEKKVKDLEKELNIEKKELSKARNLKNDIDSEIHLNQSQLKQVEAHMHREET